MKYWKLLILTFMLGSCTNHNVVEVTFPQYTHSHNPTMNEEKPVEPMAEKPAVAPLVSVPPTVVQKVIVDTCPKFKMPALAETPPLPKQVSNGVQLSPEELTEILSKHIVELRKKILDNRSILNKAYADYLGSCKK